MLSLKSLLLLAVTTTALAFAVSDLHAQSGSPSTNGASGPAGGGSTAGKRSPEPRSGNGSETIPLVQRAHRCIGADTACATGKVPTKALLPAELRPGAHVNPAQLHPVTRPGLYGVGKAPRGSSYGIVNGQLLRYDSETLQIQSVIRMVETILD